MVEEEAGEVTGETGVEAEMVPFLYNIRLGTGLAEGKGCMAQLPWKAGSM